MTEILLDAVIDTLKLVPFLFVTYFPKNSVNITADKPEVHP